MGEILIGIKYINGKSETNMKTSKVNFSNIACVIIQLDLMKEKLMAEVKRLSTQTERRDDDRKF